MKDTTRRAFLKQTSGPFALAEANLLDRRRFLAGVASLAGPAAIAIQNPLYLETANGWYIQGGKAIWGYAIEGQMWGGYRGNPTGWWTDCDLRPSIIRNAQGQVGPNRTEDLDKLTDN